MRVVGPNQELQIKLNLNTALCPGDIQVVSGIFSGMMPGSLSLRTLTVSLTGPLCLWSSQATSRRCVTYAAATAAHENGAKRPKLLCL